MESIGGRTKTIYPTHSGWQGESLELGANWVEGRSPENPLYHLSQVAGIEGSPSIQTAVVAYDANGQKVSAEQHKQNKVHFDAFMKWMKQQRTPDNKKVSVQAAASKFIRQHKLNAEETRGFLFHISHYIENEYAQSIDQLSMPYYADDKEFDGPYWLVTHSYAKLVNHLVSKIQGHVKTQEVVTEVHYKCPGQVELLTQSGKTYFAEQVLVTVPLNVLKKKIKFIPALPEEKLKALSHMSMGSQNKLWLKFPYVFWDKKAEYIGYQPDVSLRGKVKRLGPALEFVNIYRHTGQPMLLGFVAGEHGKYLEQLDDKAITEEVLQTLRKMYGPKVPNPTAYYYTRWGKDPFALGSYSSLLPGGLANNQDYRVLAQSIDDRIFFAGEATHDVYPGTVHGAYLSGIREAKKLLRVTKK